MTSNNKECVCEYGPIKPIPVDAETGFCQSFLATQSDEIRQFFGEFGFVVVRNIASEENLALAEQEMMKIADLDDEKMKLENLESTNWLRVYGNSYNRGKGFVGYMPALGKGVTNIRQSTQVQSVFSNLLRRKDLYAKLDRFGLMRPTINNPKFKTETGFVHWDQNPTFEPNFSRVQGVLTLSDHTATSGGFHCVPGFVPHFNAYADANPIEYGEEEDLVALEGDCLRENHLTRILAPRGSLIIWDSRTPHGNWPNQDSAEWRKVLYMTFFPQPDEQDLRDLRRREMCLTNGYQEMIGHLDETGRRLFALEDYPDDMLPSKEELEKSVDMKAMFSNRQNGLR